MPAGRWVRVAAGTRVRRTAGAELSARTPGEGCAAAGYREDAAAPARLRRRAAHPVARRLTRRARTVVRREREATPVRAVWAARNAATAHGVSDEALRGGPRSQSAG